MRKMKYVTGVKKEKWDWEALLLISFWCWLFCIRPTVQWGEREWSWPYSKLELLDVVCLVSSQITSAQIMHPA